MASDGRRRPRRKRKDREELARTIESPSSLAQQLAFQNRQAQALFGYVKVVFEDGTEEELSGAVDWAPGDEVNGKKISSVSDVLFDDDE